MLNLSKVTPTGSAQLQLQLEVGAPLQLDIKAPLDKHIALLDHTVSRCFVYTVGNRAIADHV